MQQRLFMQQSIVCIKQFIDEIIKSRTNNKTNFFVLTTTDLAKLVFDDNVVILQDKITKHAILSAVKENKIDTIISFIGDKDNDKILNDEDFLNEKRLNIFYKEFYLANRSKRHFANIAKQSGFFLDKSRTLVDKTYYKNFTVVAIKDEYNNQHILDFFSVANIGNNKVFFAPAFLNDVNDDKVCELMSKMQRFGELLSIQNLIYAVHFSVDESGVLIYNNIEYGLTEETIFSLQRLQINIATITRKILEKKMLFFPLNKQIIAYSFNYKDTLTINFASRFDDCCLKSLLIKNKRLSNKKLIDGLINNDCKIQDKCFFVSRKISSLKNIFYLNFLSSTPDYYFDQAKYNNIKNRYILMIFDDEDVKCDDNIPIFANLCNRIKAFTEKEVILLCKSCPPMLSLINFEHIIVVNDINEDVVGRVIDAFAVKYVYTNVKKSTKNIVSAVNKCDAEIYGFDASDNVFYDDSDDISEAFAKKIGCNFKSEVDNSDNIFDVFCINDKHGNSFFNIILSRHVAGHLEASYFVYPPVFENFEIQEKIEICFENILTNIKTSGPLHIIFSYKNGELYILNIERVALLYYFVLNLSIKKQVIIDVMAKSLLGRSIDINIVENRNILLLPYRNDMFYRTMIFRTSLHKSISLSGGSNKSILSNFQRLAF